MKLVCTQCGADVWQVTIHQTTEVWIRCASCGTTRLIVERVGSDWHDVSRVLSVGG